MKPDPLEIAGRRLGAVLRGKWRLERVLGVAGTAAVYFATHRNAMRVAIKILHEAFAADDDVRQRFLREGYVANRIGHPAVVQVLDDDTTDDGSPFLVMEFLDGVALDAHLAKHRRLSVPEVSYVADIVLSVLTEAHRIGIIHRDIKPGNVFLTRDGAIRMLDFGLARVREAASLQVLTREGILMGTPGYMAPEQTLGDTNEITPATDLFGVGALMFKALSGQAVHLGKNKMHVLMAAASQQVRPLAEAAPEVPAPIAAVVDRALRFKASERWASAEEMAHALRRALAEVPPSSPAASTSEADCDVLITPSLIELASRIRE